MDVITATDLLPPTDVASSHAAILLATAGKHGDVVLLEVDLSSRSILRRQTFRTNSEPILSIYFAYRENSDTDPSGHCRLVTIEHGKAVVVRKLDLVVIIYVILLMYIVNAYASLLIIS